MLERIKLYVILFIKYFSRVTLGCAVDLMIHYDKIHDSNKLVVSKNRMYLVTDDRFTLFPKYLIVKGKLYCVNTGIKRMPEFLYVDGALSCNENNLTKLPEFLIVKGNLLCHDNDLTKLPDYLIVEGDLFCYNNNLDRLPDNMVVKGDVYCNRNRITHKIKSKIGGKIIMDDKQQVVYDRGIKFKQIIRNIKSKKRNYEY